MGDEKGTKSGKRSWVLVLFGLPFAAIGLGVLGFAVVPDVLEWQAMKAWEPVQAEVLAAELEVHSGSDSTTYEATGRYRYAWQGETYENDRVALGSGADNVGDFQQDLARQLERALADGEPVTVWVDPAQPQSSVVNRELRTGLLAMLVVFGLIFALVGLGLMGAGLFMRDGSTGVVSESEPWRGRKEWASPEIRAGGKGTAVFAWLFAILWCAVSGVATVFALDEVLEKQNYPALFVLLFPLVGIGLLVWAVRATLSARKFGELVLRLDPHPGSIGGDVGGMIDVPLPYEDRRAVALSLVCQRVYVTRSGKNRETRRDAVWADTRHFFGEPAINGTTRVHFRFPVPAELPPSSQPDNDYHEWKLDIECEVPGVDLSRSFEIPVFATAQITRVASRVRESQEESLAHLEALMNLQQIPGGVSMEYRAGRSWKGGLGVFVFGLLFCIVPGYMLYTDEVPAFVRLLFGGIFGFVALICMAAGVWMAGNGLRVEIDEVSARMRRRLFGFPVQEREIPRIDIDGIVAIRGGSSTVGNKVTVHYSLAVKAKDGQTREIGDGFRGFGEAERAGQSVAAFTRLPFLGEASKGSAFAARKAAYLAGKSAAAGKNDGQP